jgi:hypothetical protein
MIELMKNCFYNPFEHIWSKMVLTLKIMDFENMVLTKVVNIYVIKGVNAIYTWYNINV